MKSKAFWKAPFKNVKRLFPPDFMNNNNKKKSIKFHRVFEIRPEMENNLFTYYC